MKCYRAEVAKELRLYGEMHRFITMLAHSRGFKVAEVEVNHRPRIHGQSKYGFRRLVTGLLDLLTVRFMTVHGERPSHAVGVFGLLALAVGALGLGYLAGLWALGYRPIGNRPVLIYSVALLLLGAQFVALGMLSELIVWRLAGLDGANRLPPPVANRLGLRSPFHTKEDIS